MQPVRGEDMFVSKLMASSRESKMWQESLELLVLAAVLQQVTDRPAAK